MLESRHIEQGEQAATRDRLVEAAGEVFADRGFKDATIREICGRAGANVASVNYHFGDKGGLYFAVLQSAYEHAERSYPFDPGMVQGSPKARSASDRLRMFIQLMMQRMLDPGKPAWHGRLMAREMVEPTDALEHLVRQFMRPKRDILEGIVRELLGEGAPDELVHACARSVIGQTIFYHQNRPVIQMLYPGMSYSKDGVQKLAEHVAAFSLAAIDAMRARAGGAK